ncbi:MAG: hypothetical protein ACLU3I_14415 [Acutalibacteraceae bacterium]
MEITFVNPGADYMIQRMMDFQAEEESAFGLNRCTISIRSWTRSMLRACHSMNEQNILHGQCALFTLNQRIRSTKRLLYTRTIESLQTANYCGFIGCFWCGLCQLV